MDLPQKPGYRNSRGDQIGFAGFRNAFHDLFMYVLEKQRDRQDDFHVPFLDILNKVAQSVRKTDRAASREQEEIACVFERMMKGKYREGTFARLDMERGRYAVHVRTDIPVRQHNAFAGSRCTGCKKDNTYLILVDRIVQESTVIALQQPAAIIYELRERHKTRIGRHLRLDQIGIHTDKMPDMKILGIHFPKYGNHHFMMFGMIYDRFDLAAS